MAENNLEFLERIAKNADKSYMLSKSAEECMELATVLIQQVNKPDKNYVANIMEEVAHVTMRMLQLTFLYGEEGIKDEFDKKIVQLKKWEEERGYRNL